MIRRLLLVATAAASVSAVASAQTAASKAQYTVPSIVGIDYTTTSPTTSDFTHPGAAAFTTADSAYVSPDAAVTFKVWANRDWQVTVGSAAAWSFTPLVAGATTSKATTDVQVLTTAGASAWAGVDNATSQQIKTGNPGRTTFSPSIRLVSRLVDTPGSYKLDLTYTIAAQ